VKLARYMGGGEIAIVSESEPSCPAGGLLVRTEASGLCSGELMDWYMDAKIPHVLGHEVCGVVVESQNDRFPVGSRVAPHHHAPCMTCELCRRGAYVHCAQWKRTKLVPGGMAEYFAVAAENLTDCHLTSLNAHDAALMEPLACVAKSIRRARAFERPAVIGMGVMGLMHMLALRQLNPVGYEVSTRRAEYARGLGLTVSSDPMPTDAVFVCPGSEEAIEFGMSIVEPDGVIVLFSPLPPPGAMSVDLNRLYFRDVRVVTSYSCGPEDTAMAMEILESGDVRAEQVVSDFISLEELPRAYKAMKSGEILKPMVLF